MRLRRVSPDGPGWTRRRAGRGFVYLDEQGRRLGGEDVERVRALVIPPAWEHVWISPAPNGHLQAVGTDAAGRRQYLYHEEWRRRRDAQKFDRVLAMAKTLPRARDRLLDDLDGGALSEASVLATAVRLIDVGYFRIGSDVYADEHGSYGLTTLERRHVRRRGGTAVFEFTGKSGVDHVVEVDDPVLVEVIARLRRRRGGDERLLAWKNGSRWRSVDAKDVNDYLRDVFAADVTAKDFRTWHATVIAAAALAAPDRPADGDGAGVPAKPLTKTARKRAVRAAIAEVAEYLGNTPAIARKSYVDPRVIDLYEAGTTIAAAVRRRSKSADERQAMLERAVLRLLRDG
jgi:DNA topoisomerase IB